MLGGKHTFETKEEFLEYASTKKFAMEKLKPEILNKYITVKGYRIVKNNGVVSLESDGTSVEQDTEQATEERNIHKRGRSIVGIPSKD